jgi:hypothetical protein
VLRQIKKNAFRFIPHNIPSSQPRLRWINDVEDDLRKFGVKRWRTKALDREESASIIREAKAKLKGPYAIGRRRI